MKLVIVLGVICIICATFAQAVNSLIGAMLESALESELDSPVDSALNATDSDQAPVITYNNSFPRIDFLISINHTSMPFNLTDKAGTIFKATLEEAFKQSLWFAGNEVKMSINATNEGVAVFLTNCRNEPISLKPNVIDEDYYIQKSVVENCIFVHLIATDGASEGHVSFFTTEHPKWIHAHILFAVTFAFILIILLIRQCANHILRSIYSYDVMPEDVHSA